MHFHAFLVEGLSRWNRDRELEAVNRTDSAPASSYYSELASAVNQLSHRVLARELYPNFRGPNKYTGIAKTCLLQFFYNFILFSHSLLVCFDVLIFIATGELIHVGVEYLYAQTGKTLQNILNQQEEAETPMDAPDADNEDEGFPVRTYCYYIVAVAVILKDSRLSTIMQRVRAPRFSMIRNLHFVRRNQ